MEKFSVLKSIAVPWLMPNVDTDIITPMRRMLMNPNELDKYSFEAYRFVDGNGDKGELSLEFPLNQEGCKKAKIMIVGENFGGGSSRETAPMAIAKLGVRCLIGSSFGGIFFKNCFQQGILPIVLPKGKVIELASQKGEFEIDLPQKVIRTPLGEVIAFEVENLRLMSLSEGLDDVGMTQKKTALIEKFFKKDRAKRKWLYNTGA
ncbi:3-isopropylmalate dehydratase small subunit [Sporomusa sp.]|uniref:3-isopropylmalate dehydratase small subunit n=1 Tax=Sporomusa sp. TaxID=2078658 RepID=UPI002C67D9DD|nr:3-isopropylmalate dehydratase small subunit [Sporomusa sp.]HWR06566.1 3-isopropylmalate dehydratase small subunit [Sporomusa sp.]